ncbi:response regulator transcription factor [Alteromonadaceae bacterium M269]|nr:response regulator transcription factor [Alteromonadaceae bacterium M269]
MLIDRMLPDMDGASVCTKIRQTSDVPVLMLTGKVSSQDLVDGLEAGADEYIKKPFSHVELMARIKAHLRRTKVSTQTNTIKAVGSYQIDAKAKQISFAKHKLKLTKTEYDLLYKLLSYPECVFTREQLFTAVFNYNSDSSDRTVDVHLHNVKRKISAISQSHHGITAIYGVGYKLSLE